MEARVERLEGKCDALAEGVVELRLQTGENRVAIGHVAVAVKEGFTRQEQMWGKHRLREDDTLRTEAEARARRLQWILGLVVAFFAAACAAAAGVLQWASSKP